MNRFASPEKSTSWTAHNAERFYLHHVVQIESRLIINLCKYDNKSMRMWNKRSSIRIRATYVASGSLLGLLKPNPQFPKKFSLHFITFSTLLAAFCTQRIFHTKRFSHKTCKKFEEMRHLHDLLSGAADGLCTLGTFWGARRCVFGRVSGRRNHLKWFTTPIGYNLRITKAHNRT